jgi:Flp pilus assembly protein TadG
MPQKLSTLQHDEDGAVAVEASLVLPVLLLLALGILQFGIIMNTYMTATSAASAGLQTFSVMRGISGSYTAALAAAKSAALRSIWNVSSSDVSVSFLVNGSSCASDTACDLALTNAAPPSTGGAGGTSQVSISIACKGLKFLPELPVMCPVNAMLQGTVQ